MRPHRTWQANLAPWPIVKWMALGLEKVLGFLENIESHPLMTKLKQAIDWVIQSARNIREKVLNDIEIKEAEARAQVFAARRAVKRRGHDRPRELANAVLAPGRRPTAMTAWGATPGKVDP